MKIEMTCRCGGKMEVVDYVPWENEAAEKLINNFKSFHQKCPVMGIGMPWVRETADKGWSVPKVGDVVKLLRSQGVLREGALVTVVGFVPGTDLTGVTEIFVVGDYKGPRCQLRGHFPLSDCELVKPAPPMPDPD